LRRVSSCKVSKESKWLRNHVNCFRSHVFGLNIDKTNLIVIQDWLPIENYTTKDGAEVLGTLFEDYTQLITPYGKYWKSVITDKYVTPILFMSIPEFDNE